MFLYVFYFCIFFFKQKTAYEMRISDWSSDVCSSDLFVKRWDDLIGWEGRTAGEADFFPRLLAAHGVRHVADIATGTGFHAVMLAGAEIGRASCRERVCQYV